MARQQQRTRLTMVESSREVARCVVMGVTRPRWRYVWLLWYAAALTSLSCQATASDAARNNRERGGGGNQGNQNNNNQRTTTPTTPPQGTCILYIFCKILKYSENVMKRLLDKFIHE